MIFIPLQERRSTLLTGSNMIDPSYSHVFSGSGSDDDAICIAAPASCNQVNALIKFLPLFFLPLPSIGLGK